MCEKTLESSLDWKEIKPVDPKGNQSWILIGITDAEAETPILWSPDAKNWLIEKIPMLKKIEGRKKRVWQGWDGWMASLPQRTWIWASSGSWWWTGKPGVLQSMGSQRVGHDCVTELNWFTDTRGPFCFSISTYIIITLPFTWMAGPGWLNCTWPQMCSAVRLFLFSISLSLESPFWTHIH